MRVLLTTRGSAGHVGPLAPFGQACRRAGHEVLVAAQRQHEANVRRTGLAFAPVADPPEDEWRPMLERLAGLDLDAANELMLADYFARIDTRAALPDLTAVVDDYDPTVIVRESWEFASTLVAEARGIPIVRVALGLAALEETSIGLAAPALDVFRAELGLSPDPDGARLRATPYLTTVPEALETRAAAPPGRTHRFAHAVPEPASPLPDWWAGRSGPLVYLTLGSVTAGAHLPYFPAVYREAIDSLGPLDVRVLVTLGDAGDPTRLGPLPGNVHVERWVSQATVLPHATAVVCHGGFGSTLGALAHGVPLVVLPLFSVDQWANAAAVARVGAGVALDDGQGTRRGLEPPGADVTGGLGKAVARVLDDPAYARRARRIAADVQALPPVDDAVGAITATVAVRPPR